MPSLDTHVSLAPSLEAPSLDTHVSLAASLAGASLDTHVSLEPGTSLDTHERPTHPREHPREPGTGTEPGHAPTWTPGTRAWTPT